MGKHGFPKKATQSSPLGIGFRVVVANELPNMPHVDLGLAKNYAIAKIKEAVIAATGR